MKFHKKEPHKFNEGLTDLISEKVFKYFAERTYAPNDYRKLEVGPYSRSSIMNVIDKIGHTSVLEAYFGGYIIYKQNPNGEIVANFGKAKKEYIFK